MCTIPSGTAYLVISERPVTWAAYSRDHSKDSGVGVCLSLACTERVRSAETWKSGLVLPEPGGFRELNHRRHRQDCFTPRAGGGEVPHNLRTPGMSQDVIPA